MHSDRELLALAAKAAGFGDPEGNFIWTESEYPRGSKTNGALWNYIGWCDTAQLWNPLTDDGDALRLAVSLGFIVDIDTEEHYTEIEFTSNYEDKSASEGHGFDATEATRRAITIAAAKIGKEMK